MEKPMAVQIRWRREAIDVAAILAVGIVSVIVDASAKPHFREVRPEELTVDVKKFYHPSTVPTWSLGLLAVLFPLLVIWVASTAFLGRPLGTRDGWCATKGLVAALVSAYIVTDALKLIVGRLRPNFFYSCWPDGNAQWYGDPGAGHPHCTNPNEAMVLDARKSFPSGHSSMSAAGLGFLTMYAFGKLGSFHAFAPVEDRYARWMVALSPSFVAIIVGATRVMDNKHHWQDVVTGLLLGFVLAWAAYRLHYGTRVLETTALEGKLGVTPMRPWVAVPDWVARPGRRRSGGVGDVVGGGHAWEELHPLASDEEGDVEQGAGARERFAAGPVQQLT